jgi:ABC-2 type transport system permease protein
VAVRFVYPLPSLEGRAWWIVRAAPVRLERVWASKFWSGFLPLAVLGVGLVVGTNGLLAVPGTVTAAVLPLVVLLLAAIVSLGLAFGAAHAELDARDAARIATGFGAILYMLSAMALIAVVVVLAAWPVQALLAAARAGAWPQGRGLVAMAAALGAAASACAVAFAVARGRGIQAMRRLSV